MIRFVQEIKLIYNSSTSDMFSRWGCPFSIFRLQ